jgi:PHP domain
MPEGGASRMGDSFVHLHVHTEYSMLDGAARLKDLFAEVERQKMPGVAMTDHGNTHGAYDFYKQATAAGVTPIIGCLLAGQEIVTSDHRRTSRRQAPRHRLTRAQGRPETAPRPRLPVLTGRKTPIPYAAEVRTARRRITGSWPATASKRVSDRYGA